MEADDALGLIALFLADCIQTKNAVLFNKEVSRLFGSKHYLALGACICLSSLGAVYIYEAEQYWHGVHIYEAQHYCRWVYACNVTSVMHNTLSPCDSLYAHLECLQSCPPSWLSML